MRDDDSFKDTRPHSREWPEALREGASRLRPPFSEQRHQRIMRAVRSCGAVELSPHPDERRKRRAGLTVALSAACLLCAALTARWVLSPSQQDRPSIVNTPDQIAKEPEVTVTDDVRHPEVDWPLAELQAPPAELLETQSSASALWDEQWQALDRDIGRMAELTVHHWPLGEFLSSDM